MNLVSANILGSHYHTLIEREYLVNLRVLVAMPKDMHAVALSTEMPTVLELSWTLISVDVWYLQAVVGHKFLRRSHRPDAVRNIAEAIDWYRLRMPELIRGVGEMSPTQLIKPLAPSGGNIPHESVLYLPKMLHASIYHRSQLIFTLSAVGRKLKPISSLDPAVRIHKSGVKKRGNG